MFISKSWLQCTSSCSHHQQQIQRMASPAMTFTLTSALLLSQLFLRLCQPVEGPSPHPRNFVPQPSIFNMKSITEEEQKFLLFVAPK